MLLIKMCRSENLRLKFFHRLTHVTAARTTTFTYVTSDMDKTYNGAGWRGTAAMHLMLHLARHLYKIQAVGRNDESWCCVMFSALLEFRFAAPIVFCPSSDHGLAGDTTGTLHALLT